MHELQRVEIIWAIKDKSISSTFVDPGAAQFFISSFELQQQQADDKVKGQVETGDKQSQQDDNNLPYIVPVPVKRAKYAISGILLLKAVCD